MGSSVAAPRHAGSWLPREADVASRYAVALAASAGAVLLRYMLSPLLGSAAPLAVLLAAVLVAAAYGGTAMGILTVAITLVAGTFLFIEPPGELGQPSTAELARQAIFVGEGLLISWIVGSRREALRRASAHAADLERSHRRYRQLVDADLIGVLVTGPRGTLVDANNAALAMLGYARAELMDRALSGLLAPEEARANARIQAELEERGAWSPVLTAYVKKSGERVHVLSAGARAPEGRGVTQDLRSVTVGRQLPPSAGVGMPSRSGATNVIAYLVDVEAQWRSERELRDAYRELDTFASTVAHDLRAPLRGIHTLAQALAEDFGPSLPARGSDYTRRILGAEDRMQRLIDDLLAYSRLSRRQMTLHAIDLRTAVDGALARIEGDARERRARITWRRPAEPVRVLANRTGTESAIQNVLANALLYVAPGQAPDVELTIHTAGERACLAVRDRGIGIAPEDQARIFEPFQRLHAATAYGGTGVGLAIVRRTLDKMGASIAVESARGRGSRFVLTFPRAGRG